MNRTFAGHNERVKRGRGGGVRGAPGRQCRRGRHHRARGISRVLSPPKRGRTISLGPASPPASSDLPGTRTGRATPRPLFGLAPGGACRATSVTGRPVRSYRTVSPLPEPPRGGHRRSALCCAFRRRHQTAPGRYPAPCPVELGLSSGSLATKVVLPAILTRTPDQDDTPCPVDCPEARPRADTARTTLELVPWQSTIPATMDRTRAGVLRAAPTELQNQANVAGVRG